MSERPLRGSSRRSARALLAAICAAFSVGGCGIHASGGFASANNGGALTGLSRLSAQTQPFERDGFVIGGTMVLRHSDLDHPVVARSGRFAAGYRARSVLGPLGYDLGYEFGFGEPSGFEFARSGLFNGLNAALSLNIVGTEPSERRFHLIEISYDVVLQVDGGAWMGPPPDSSVDELPGQVYFEGAVHLGLRFNLESDMFLGASS